MAHPALRDWLFHVEAPSPAEGWCFVVRGREERCHGPYSGLREARAARMQLFRRWCAAARARGGWAWKSTDARWVLTLPADLHTTGLPLERTPCSRHTGA